MQLYGNHKGLKFIAIVRCKFITIIGKKTSGHFQSLIILRMSTAAIRREICDGPISKFVHSLIVYLCTKFDHKMHNDFAIPPHVSLCNNIHW